MDAANRNVLARRLLDSCERELLRAEAMQPIRRILPHRLSAPSSLACLAADARNAARASCGSLIKGIAKAVEAASKGGWTTDVGGGRFVSVSTWQTHDQAEAATEKTAQWVGENLADSVSLEENLVGEMTTLAATERSAV